jgi:hypothetical protein
MTSLTAKDLEHGVRPSNSRHTSRPRSSQLDNLSRVSTRRSARSQRYGGEDGYSGSVFEREHEEREDISQEEDPASSDEKDGEKQRESKGQKKKSDEDIIDVGWDGGDNDPLNPRQMGKARRYMITALMATTSTFV